MRILTIRFKNLNSLEGEWTIDLTHPAFLHEGIFAITGPTGAGKTTILDAICLALYGRTPRLSKINKNANEIMSRHSGECFSEVVFEAASGKYRCYWSQHKSRRKANGELQSPKQEISDVITGKILESKIKNVAAYIENVTGMDFDRFTRSMMLAQGGFAAFLQASPDERSPILEQITGTEIYSQISKGVHERRVNEHKKLELLHAECSQCVVLSSEEEETLSLAYHQKQCLDKELAEKIHKNQQTLQFLENVRQLEQSLKSVQVEISELDKKKIAFQPKQSQLDWANKALELEADYAELCVQRKNLKDLQFSLTQCQNQQPSIENKVKQKLSFNLEAEEQYRLKKNFYSAQLPIIGHVRTLDRTLSDRELEIAELTKEIQCLNLELEKILDELEHDEKRLKQKNLALERLENILLQTKGDAALIESLALIQKQAVSWQELNQCANEKRLEFVHLQEKVKKANEDFLLSKKTVSLSEDKVSQLKLDHHSEVDRINLLLEGKDVVAWRQALSCAMKRKECLVSAKREIDQFMTFQNNFTEFTKKQQQCLQSLDVILKEITQQHEIQTSVEADLLLQEETVKRLRLIANFEEARHQLEEEKPCPLCGSLDHPYVHSYSDEDKDEAERKLKQLKNESKQSSQILFDKKIKQGELNQQLHFLIDNIADQKKSMDSALSLFNTYVYELAVRELFNRLPGIEDVNRLDKLVVDHESEMEKLNKVLETVESAIKRKDNILATLSKMKDDLSTAQEQLQEKQFNLHSAQQEWDLATRSYQLLNEQRSESLAQFNEYIKPFISKALKPESLPSVLDELKQRRCEWESNCDKRETTQQELISLTHQKQLKYSARNNLEVQLTHAQKKHQTLVDSQMKQKQERNSIFECRHPDEVENELIFNVETAQEIAKQCQKEWYDAQSESAQLNAKMYEFSIKINQLQKTTDNAERDFTQRLDKKCFHDEHGFREARLNETQRQILHKQSHEISQKFIELQETKRNIEKQLDSDKEKINKENGLERLKVMQISLIDQQKELNKELGVIQGKLTDNEKLKASKKKAMESLLAQQTEIQRWDNLHSLIGSSDGKKFRNFAQGLTFELLVSRANDQLQKMTDRYLLFRSRVQPLSLNVLDNYQAGEERSTQNLSGGESFIVSLSLALGLANIASQNVRVDSLFLDEGFGTLDEEALDTALETLSHLNKEGKLIGVISHVPALKERISTQIQVKPSQGGKSQLVGPGCMART